jgi:hypothetical protein
VSASGDVIVDVGVENTKPFDSIIDELLDESALEILLKAPFYRLPVCSDIVAAEMDANDNKIGKIYLPYDFLRLVSFKMKKWLQPVTAFALPGDPVAVRQSNKYIRGGVAKPVAVLHNTDGECMAYYYSVPSADDHEVEFFDYIPRLAPTKITDKQMIDAMCWVCAGKTLNVLGEKGLADMCYENAKGLMM